MYILFLIKVIRVYKVWIPSVSPVSLQVPHHREPPFYFLFSKGIKMNVFLSFAFDSTFYLLHLYVHTEVKNWTVHSGEENK